MNERKEKSAVGSGIPSAEIEKISTESITDNSEKIKPQNNQEHHPQQDHREHEKQNHRVAVIPPNLGLDTDVFHL